MPVAIEDLRSELQGMELPECSITIEAHESAIADHAISAVSTDDGLAHPLWFIIASLRGLGVTVDLLCELAHKEEADTLLFGGVDVTQKVALRVGSRYDTKAKIVEIDRRSMHDGSTLDLVVVNVELHESGNHLVGCVKSTYLFKRGLPVS